MWSRPPCVTGRFSTSRAIVTSVVSRIGIASTSSGSRIVATVVPATVQLAASASEARPKPIVCAPESPMNTEAPRCGLRLNGRNAAHASPSASASARTVSFSCSVSASIAKYPHETIASVAARPSMLSSRLNAFVIPTSHSSPIAHARMSLPTISTFRPLASTTTAAVICAASFARGLRCRRSSTRPATKTIVTPARIPPSSPDHSTAPLASASAIPATNPAKMPTPPKVGVGCSCQRSSDGTATRRAPRGERRRSQRTAAATENAAIETIAITTGKG